MYVYIGSSVGGGMVLIVLCIFLIEKFDKKYKTKNIRDYRNARKVKVYTEDSETV
jgi:hypothetical protein